MEYNYFQSQDPEQKTPLFWGHEKKLKTHTIFVLVTAEIHEWKAEGQRLGRVSFQRPRGKAD